MTIDISNLNPEKQVELNANPELKKALEEACNVAHGELIYGGIGVKAKNKKDIPKVLREIEKKRKEIDQKVNRIKKEAEQSKRKYKAQMSQARLQAATRGLNIPSFEGLTPEQIKVQSGKMRREAELRANPMARRIMKIFQDKAVKAVGLACPECGEGDRGNKKNRKPWCLKCDAPLVKPKKLKNWIRMKEVKE